MCFTTALGSYAGRSTREIGTQTQMTPTSVHSSAPRPDKQVWNASMESPGQGLSNGITKFFPTCGIHCNALAQCIKLEHAGIRKYRIKIHKDVLNFHLNTQRILEFSCKIRDKFQRELCLDLDALSECIGVNSAGWKELGNTVGKPFSRASI